MPFPSKTNAEAIVDAAASLVQADGMAALSMRVLALKLGVRASSLYRHFPDRAAIESALAQRALAQLLDLLNGTTRGTAGDQALSDAACKYLEFAFANPALYTMLMGANQAVTRPLFDLLVRLLTEATKAPRDEAGALAFWSLLHGFVVLQQTGHFGPTVQEVVFERGTKALLRGLSLSHAASGN